MAFDYKKPAKVTKFVYKQRSADDIRARAVRRGSRFDSIWKDGVNTIRLKEGDNMLRVLPSTWDKRDHYSYQLFVHAYVGPDNGNYLCLRKHKNQPCAICDAAQAATKDGDKQAASDLQWSEKWACYVVDRDERDPKNNPKVYEMGQRLDSDLCALAESKKTRQVRFIDDPDKGFDIIIRRTGMTKTNTRYLLQIDSEPSPIDADPEVQSGILDYITKYPIPDLLKFQTNEFLAKMISGSYTQKDEEVEEDTDIGRASRQHGFIEDDNGPPFDENEDHYEDAEETGTEADAEDSDDDDRYAPRGDEEEEQEEQEPKRPAATGSKDRVRAAEREVERHQAKRAERLKTPEEFPKFNIKPRAPRPSRD